MTDVGVAAVPGGERLHLASAEQSAAFAVVYRQHYGEVASYCSRLLRDDNVARDVAQEAFVRLFARWRTVNEPRAYVFLVATNLVRDEWRRRTKVSNLFERLKPFVSETAPPVDVELGDIVARLPKRLRDVVVLHLVADLPVAEVARVTGIPEGTVKRRLYEARALLRLDWLEIR